MKPRFTLDPYGEFPVEVYENDGLVIVLDPCGAPEAYRYDSANVELGEPFEPEGFEEWELAPDSTVVRMALAEFQRVVVLPYRIAQAKRADDRKREEKRQKAAAKAIAKARGKSIRY